MGDILVQNEQFTMLIVPKMPMFADKLHKRASLELVHELKVSLKFNT